MATKRSKPQAFIRMDTVIGILLSLAVFAFLFFGFPSLFPSASPMSLFINALTVFSAWVGFMAMLRLRRFMDERNEKLGRVWRFFVLGVFAWFLGKCMFAFFSVAMQVTVPFPSIADIPYSLGYILILFGLSHAHIYLNRPLLPSEIAVLLTVALISIAAISITLWPAMLSPTISNAGKLLDVVYPVGDLLIVLTSLALFLYLQRTPSGLCWGVFLLGFLAFGFSDLWFSYLSSAKLYYYSHPVDFVYCASYWVWFFGALLFEWIYRDNRSLTRELI